MTVIHMDTEQVKTLAEKFKTSASFLQQSWQEVIQRCAGMDWSGFSRDEFLQETHDRQRQINALAERLDVLSLELKGEVAQWEERAAHFGDGFSRGNFVPGSDMEQFAPNVWITPDKSFRLANTFALFTTLPEGRDLIQDATQAGLFFVIIENGQEIGYLGDPNGKRIPIQWNELEDAYGQYIPTAGEEHVILDSNSRDDMHIYLNTLGHEMQHAIDFNTDAIDHAAIQRMNLLNSESVANMSVDEVEDVLAGGLTEYVKSEVNAHDRGNTIDAGANKFEEKLDASDGIYTQQEFDYVVNKRGYEVEYEKNINAWLKELYGSDTQYRADVWLDNTGNLRVDIDQSRPLIPRVLDTINIPTGA